MPVLKRSQPLAAAGFVFGALALSRGLPRQVGPLGIVGTWLVTRRARS